MMGAVAAGNPDTANAAARVLRDGGNAADAAIAGAFAAFACEPLLASAGGAGVLTVADGDVTETVDFFSTVPGLGVTASPTLDFDSVEVDFGEATQIFHVGRGSVAVPLALAGLRHAAERYGSRALAELVRPATELARSGVTATAEVALVYDLLWPILSRDPHTAALFCPQGRPPRGGDLLQNHALADALAELGANDGALPRFDDALLAEFGPARGGLITVEDHRAARVETRPVDTTRIGDWAIATPATTGGKLVKVILDALRAGEPEPDEAEEALRFALASQRGHAARAAMTSTVTMPGSTTHLSVIDDRGMLAAITLTNGEGSGHLIGDTGIQANNFLGEEDLNPDGFHRYPAGIRLPTMMAPTIAHFRGAPALALGSGGSNRIRTAIAQTLYRLTCCSTSLREAVLAPRIHAEGDTVWLELQGFGSPDRVLHRLRGAFRIVHPFRQRAFFFGGVHAVTPDGAVADPRRGGGQVIVL